MLSTSNHVGPESFFTPEVVKHVESVARSMIGCSGLTGDDFEDLCQDFYLQIAQAMSKFDPARSTISTYACRIVDRRKNRVYRERIAKHEDVPSVPLIESSDEDDDDSVGCATDQKQYTVDNAMRHLDVMSVVATLPEKHRRFCEALMDGYSIREAAQRVGYSSGREVFNHVLPSIRKKFVAAGISEIF